jgi:hypothetical protein
MTTKSKKKPATVEFTRKELRTLLLDIAHQCEAAYRRGAQHALAADLTVADAEW